MVSKQIRPSTINIKNIPFQFIYHNEKHFFGATSVWVDSYNKVICSDIEKTIIDCLFKPDYSGGIVEIAKAMYMLRDMINYDKLLAYVEKFNSQATIKRLGFLLEALKIGNKIIGELHKAKTASCVIDRKSVV